jgi:hypothetical protein
MVPVRVKGGLYPNHKTGRANGGVRTSCLIGLRYNAPIGVQSRVAPSLAAHDASQLDTRSAPCTREATIGAEGDHGTHIAQTLLNRREVGSR